MSATNEEGHVTTFHIFYPQSCISFLSLLRNGKNLYDFLALDEVTARKVPYHDLVDFLQNNADVSFEFNKRFLAGIDGLLHRISQSSSMRAYEQVASLRAYFRKHHHQTRITHQDIADWLGLSRENVSIQMKKLERAGL